MPKTTNIPRIWCPGAGIILISRELDSMGDGEIATGPLVDTSDIAGLGEAVVFADIELVCKFKKKPSPGSSMTLWLVRGGEPVPCSFPAAVFPVQKRTVIDRRVLLPSTGNWRAVLKNETGQALSSRGHSLRIRMLTRHDV